MTLNMSLILELICKFGKFADFVISYVCATFYVWAYHTNSKIYLPAIGQPILERHTEIRKIHFYNSPSYCDYADLLY